MVYVYARQSDLNKYIGTTLSVEQIKNALIDMGMDLKGESEEKDPELKIEITAEKTDMVSAAGVARAIKYYLGYATTPPRYTIAPAKQEVRVKPSVQKTRPKTVAVILRDLPLTEELLDELIGIQEKIHESFGRNRKKVSIGIYPLNEFSFPVTYSGENPEDIKFRPLEFDHELSGAEILEHHEKGKMFAHLLEGHERYPVFRDANGEVLSMPPVINSHYTGRVTTSHKDLFIECSGYNLSYLDNIMKVMVTTFIEMGAKAEAVKVVYEEENETYELNLTNEEDILDLGMVNRLIGISIPEEEIEEYLNKMMYGLTKKEGEKLTVEIPSFRSDVWHDVDITDDIARAYGYNNITPRFPNIATIGGQLSYTRFRERFTETMISLGYQEIYSYILTSTKNQFEGMGLSDEKFDYVRLIDSAEEGINMCRIHILPELLRTLHINRKHRYPQKVFENGFTIQPDESTDTKARNEAHLAGALADTSANYTNIKGVLDRLLEINEVPFEIRDFSHSSFIEGRCAEILVKGKHVGYIGELHPSVLEHFGLPVPIAAFELNLEEMYSYSL